MCWPRSSWSVVSANAEPSWSWRVPSVRFSARDGCPLAPPYFNTDVFVSVITRLRSAVATSVCRRLLEKSSTPTFVVKLVVSVIVPIRTPFGSVFTSPPRLNDKPGSLPPPYENWRACLSANPVLPSVPRASIRVISAAIFAPPTAPEKPISLVSVSIRLSPTYTDWSVRPSFSLGDPLSMLTGTTNPTFC